ncbi:MAG: hypothetical protein ONB48_17535 [candidate division KSB1 bacterium]|nr:hypothetical protein [candidate division KSB1 bacterium]MDZ7275283.1 hypothetical protein [candidate division KSB1 bacterium]MDZ7287451.1 hypothetical protein [candidate division KSB1 bacterium]MDZ7299565.1 hypothetical protein [candidate division KSB1 bacterium]MDZ7308023.1 hypothetical protein [candidate division KSB1 bacterium]
MRWGSQVFVTAMFWTIAVAGNVAVGQIKGRVTLARMPALEAGRPVTKNPALCGSLLVDESLVIGKKLELKNAVVFLANVRPDTLPPVDVTLAISKCALRPRVAALLAGDRLVIENRDATLHHARGYLHRFRPGWQGVVTRDIFEEQAASLFNFAFPTAGAVAVDTLRQPGVLEIRSEIGYDGMRAWVLVLPHRFFTLTNENGEFTLDNVPPGQFDMVLWHERLGVMRQLVEVVRGRKTELALVWESSGPATAPADSLSP